jgi:hypothetical protein
MKTRKSRYGQPARAKGPAFCFLKYCSTGMAVETAAASRAAMAGLHGAKMPEETHDARPNPWHLLEKTGIAVPVVAAGGVGSCGRAERDAAEQSVK